MPDLGVATVQHWGSPTRRQSDVVIILLHRRHGCIYLDLSGGFSFLPVYQAALLRSVFFLLKCNFRCFLLYRSLHSKLLQFSSAMGKSGFEGHIITDSLLSACEYRSWPLPSHARSRNGSLLVYMLCFLTCRLVFPISPAKPSGVFSLHGSPAVSPRSRRRGSVAPPSPSRTFLFP